MANVTGFPFELILFPGGTGVAITSFTMNEATDAVEVVFQAPVAVTITQVFLRQGIVTGTSPVYRASLQGVDGSGNPDGTVKGGGSPASVTFTPVAGGNNTGQWKTLSNSYACSRGEWLALVIDYSSGTIDSSNNCSFGSTCAIMQTTHQPYGIQNNAGSRARQGTTPIYGYSDGTTKFGYPITTSLSANFNSTSTPDERGNKITIPTDWCATYKIVGVMWYGTTAAGVTFNITLYDTDGTTVLQQVTIDSDNDRATGNAARRMFMFDEATLSTLNAGSSYRLTFAPQSASPNVNMTGMSAAASSDMDAVFPGSTVCQGTTQTDAGGFTDDATTRYAINPILRDLTPPSGGSGGAALLIGGSLAI